MAAALRRCRLLRLPGASFAGSGWTASRLAVSGHGEDEQIRRWLTRGDAARGRDAVELGRCAGLAAIALLCGGARFVQLVPQSRLVRCEEEDNERQRLSSHLSRAAQNMLFALDFGGLRRFSDEFELFDEELEQLLKDVPPTLRLEASNACGDAVASLETVAAWATGRQALGEKVAASAGGGVMFAGTYYMGAASLLGLGVNGVVAGSWAAKAMAASGGTIKIFSTVWFGQALTGVGCAVYAKTILGMLLPFAAGATVLGGGGLFTYWAWKRLREREREEVVRRSLKKLQQGARALRDGGPPRSKL